MQSEDDASGPTVPAPACFVYDPVGPHALLSNYAHAPFEDETGSWRSVEHYYQAAKFRDAGCVQAIRTAPTAAAAKALAWSPDFDPQVAADWDNKRVDVMERAVRLQVSQHEASRRALLSSWPQRIFEDSPGDEFWGIGPTGIGRNMLGSVLERVRRDLLGLPELYEVPLTLRPAGCGGRSETRTVRAAWLASASLPAPHDALAYDGFETLDIRQALASEGDAARDDRHADLLDSKYAGYGWSDDARAAVPHWATLLKGVLAERLTMPLDATAVVVVGAGSANECINLWRDFGVRATLIDWGRKLADNCRTEAPEATVLRRRAEALTGVASASIDLYCSLRTYDSALIDVNRALGEARRVLRPGGLVAISISDGYLTRHGEVIRGQIGASGAIQRSTSWEKLFQAAQSAERAGFTGFTFFDLGAEIGMVARQRT